MIQFPVIGVVRKMWCFISLFQTKLIWNCRSFYLLYLIPTCSYSRKIIIVAGCYCFRAFHVFIWLISVGWRGCVHHHLKSEIFLQLRIFCWCWLVSSHSPRSSNSPNGNSQLCSAHCCRLSLSLAVGIYGCPGYWDYKYRLLPWFCILGQCSFRQTMSSEIDWLTW